MSREIPSEDEFIGAAVADIEKEQSFEPGAPEPETEAAAPTDEAASAAVESKTDTAEKTGDTPKNVDLRALQEARAEAREAKQQARVLEDRWNTFLAGQNARTVPKVEEPAADAIPDKLTQPLEYMEYLEKRLSGVEGDTQQRRQAEQQRTELTQFDGQVRDMIQTSVATDPLVGHAVEAVRRSIAREALAHFGIDPSAPVSEAQLVPVRQYIMDAQRGYAAHAIRNKLDPGQYFKGLAAGRGWDGNPLADQKPAGGAPEVQRDLSKVKDAQSRHMSLSDASGGDSVPVVDAKALAKMSQKQFNDWMSKQGNAKALDAMMGAAQ